MIRRLGRRSRYRSVAAVLAAAALAVFLAGSPALAGGLDRIAEDGVMRAGTRASAAPFAQKTATGEFAGFSVDLLGEFRAAVERSLGRAVTPELFEVTLADRLQRVAAARHPTPGPCLEEVNDAICAQNPQDLFVTLFYGIPKPDIGEFVYADAGHSPPYVVK